MEILFVILIAIILIAVAFAYGAFAWGFVFFKFWYWFILPVFTNLPEVNFIQCVGLAMFLSLFKTISPQIIKPEYLNEGATNWTPIVTPPIILFIGWLVKYYIVGY